MLFNGLINYLCQLSNVRTLVVTGRSLSIQICVDTGALFISGRTHRTNRFQLSYAVSRTVGRNSVSSLIWKDTTIHISRLVGGIIGVWNEFSGFSGEFHRLVPPLQLLVDIPYQQQDPVLSLFLRRECDGSGESTFSFFLVLFSGCLLSCLQPG